MVSDRLQRLRQRPARAGRGFSLVELVVVVSIIGILSTIAAPSFTNLIVVSRGKTSATSVYLALSRARSAAARFNTSITVTPVGGDWKLGWTICCVPGGGGAIANESALATGVTVSGAPATVVYNSSGRVQADAKFQITAQSGSKSDVRCVAADSGGRPYITQGACS